MNVPVSVSMVTAHLAVYMAVTDGGVLYNVQAARCIYMSIQFVLIFQYIEIVNSQELTNWCKVLLLD